MIGMFNIICTNIEPLLCEFNGFFNSVGPSMGQPHMVLTVPQTFIPAL